MCSVWRYSINGDWWNNLGASDVFVKKAISQRKALVLVCMGRRRCEELSTTTEPGMRS